MGWTNRGDGESWNERREVRVRPGGAAKRQAENVYCAAKLMQPGVPITEIFAVPGTGYFGYSIRFEGRSPHYTLATCLTLQDALASCDPHSERIWEEASDADEGKLLISRSYKAGSVLDRMSQPRPRSAR